MVAMVLKLLLIPFMRRNFSPKCRFNPYQQRRYWCCPFLQTQRCLHFNVFVRMDKGWPTLGLAGGLRSLGRQIFLVAQPGEKGWKFTPFSDPGGPLSIRTIKHFNLSLWTFNGSKQFTGSGGPMPGMQEPISPQITHPRLKRAHTKPERGPWKIWWANKFSFLGEAHSSRGPSMAHPPPPPVPELWLCRWIFYSLWGRVVSLAAWMVQKVYTIAKMIVWGNIINFTFVFRYQR